MTPFLAHVQIFSLTLSQLSYWPAEWYSTFMEPPRPGQGYGPDGVHLSKCVEYDGSTRLWNKKKLHIQHLIKPPRVGPCRGHGDGRRFLAAFSAAFSAASAPRDDRHEPHARYLCRLA